jgi:hypothetical protein
MRICLLLNTVLLRGVVKGNTYGRQQKNVIGFAFFPWQMYLTDKFFLFSHNQRKKHADQN